MKCVCITVTGCIAKPQAFGCCLAQPRLLCHLVQALCLCCCMSPLMWRPVGHGWPAAALLSLRQFSVPASGLRWRLRPSAGCLVLPLVQS